MANEPLQIVLVSRTAELKIRFPEPIDVSTRKVALLCIQYPLINQVRPTRSKRLLKDAFPLEDLTPAFITCEVVNDNTYVNGIDLAASSSNLLRCIDVLSLETRFREINQVTKNHLVFHDFSVKTLLGLTVKIQDLNNELINFSGEGLIMVKIMIKLFKPCVRFCQHNKSLCFCVLYGCEQYIIFFVTINIAVSLISTPQYTRKIDVKTQHSPVSSLF